MTVRQTGQCGHRDKLQHKRTRWITRTQRWIHLACSAILQNEINVTDVTESNVEELRKQRPMSIRNRQQVTSVSGCSPKSSRFCERGAVAIVVDSG